MSKERLPVEIPSILPRCSAPRGMIAPSPNCFSICARVVFSVGLASNTDRPPAFSAVGLSTAAVALAVFLGIGLVVLGLVAVTMGNLLR